MKKIEILRKVYSREHKGAAVSSAVIGYPQIDGCERINAFYLKFAEKAAGYAEKTGREKESEKSGTRIKARLLRIIPFVRYSDESRADITLDIIISDGGELLLYKRIAQSWSLPSQRLLKPEVRGGDAFFDGEDHYSVQNLFGKVNPRRMSDYVIEKRIIPRGKNMKKVENKSKQ